MATTDGQMIAEPGFVRGACPSLAAPMATGDGLLVRLRPSTPGLALSQLRALAEAASRHGNGLLEITARGNIQLRGLSAETMPALARAIDLAGIVPESGLTIETPPLSGRDIKEIADARAMTEELRRMLPAGLKLAPKLTVIIDGRGLLNLDGLTADIRLVATAPERWNVSVAGTSAQSRLVAIGLTRAQALAETIGLLRRLHGIGPRARGRDLGATLPEIAAPALSSAPRSPFGLHDMEGEGTALGLTPRFGQTSGEKLIALLDTAEAAGAGEVRTAPDHALLFLGLTKGAAESLRAAAIELGFDADADGPFRQIASCSGAGACASATYRTKTLAAELVDWVPGLFDGSIAIHLSGCPKGCAHPGAATITIIGLADVYGIVVEGAASADPVLVVDKIGLKSALQRLVARLSDSNTTNGPVKACLKRLGSEAIAAVLRQE